MQRPTEPAAQDGVETDHAVFFALTREAWQHGQAAMQDGNLPEAARWLERAHRLAPRDDAVGLSLAVLRLRQGRPADAERLLEALLERVDLREAWLALVAARLDLGAAGAAAEALGHALSRHAIPEGADVAALATRVLAGTGEAGWCGMLPDGRVRAEAAGRVRRETLPDGSIAVTRAGRALIGSPVQLWRLGRAEGVVTARGGALEGWAWHRANPDADPVLTISGAGGKGRFTICADDTGMDAVGALSRPRRFRVPPARLAGLRAPLEVRDRSGAHLPGSPLDPWGESRGAAAIAAAVARRYPARGRAVASPLALAASPVASRGVIAHAKLAPDRPLAVVVPAHRGAALTLDCLARIAATAPDGTALIVVDDATPEPALAAGLDALARDGRITLLRHAENRGFPASANAGLRAAMRLGARPDVVLLNSDTRPAPGWLAALRAAVHGAPDIGTATPLSNDATILSYPDPGKPNPAPEGRALARMAADAARAARGEVIDVPTAVGFCMYIRRECLDAVGLFRDDVFAQGYGEENDFCVRAHHLGWRHVAVPGAYVAHLSGASFGAATAPLLDRNIEVLERLHPGYNAAIMAFLARDPLAGFRRRLDALRWRAARPRPARASVYITHDLGGGVERVVQRRAAAARAEGARPVILRPAKALQAGRAAPDSVVAVEEGAAGADAQSYPNLRFAMPDELADLAALLRGDLVGGVEVHHMIGHHHALTALAGRLGAPLVFHVHDYASFCPRVSLLGPDRRYCGEPVDPATCDACVADHGSALRETIGVGALRARSARDFAAAAAVVVPSEDAAARLRRHFPGLAPVVARLGDDAALPPPIPVPAEGHRRVVVIGALGPEKGYDILLACGRDAAARGLHLDFVIVGHTSDDRRLLDTGRIFITGRYDEAEAIALIRAQGAHLAFLPSIWPETWCFALGVAWQAGLHAVVFDIGAQAERTRATGRGWVLPLGLGPVAINNRLLSVRPAGVDV